MESIDWPEWWLRRPGERDFLEGMPVIGPHARILRETRLILTAREKDVDRIKDSWAGFEAPFPCVAEREVAFGILDNYIEWPNHLFIPEDRGPIILGWIPGIWIDPEDVVDDIARAFGAKKGRLSLFPGRVDLDLYEPASKGHLVDFFAGLSRHVDRAACPDKGQYAQPDG
jgi:hypothetical protein